MKSVAKMPRIQFVVFVLSLLAFSTFCERVRYDNYRIYQAIPKISKNLQQLSDLEGKSEKLIFLNPVTIVNKQVNILVAPDEAKKFIQYLDENEIFHELLEEDFQRILDAELNEFESRSAVYDWKGYHTLQETYDWLKSLEQQYPNNVQTIIAGKSYEGRDILGVKVSFKSGNKGIFIEGCIHAREWISPATITYILNEILTSQNPDVRAMAESYDWYIFPHVNPDGFVYTHTTNRLWRKTRSPGSSCYGADPNRNWDYQWMTIGASSNECSETYAGKTQFSEIEMRTLSEYIASLKGKLHVYLAFHSYSQFFLYPFGHTEEPAVNQNDLDDIAKAAADALSKRYGTQYTFGTWYKTLYPSGGTSMDWAYAVQGIPLSYTIELRPASSINGFVLPSGQIIPTAQETLDAVVALTKKAAELKYL